MTKEEQRIKRNKQLQAYRRTKDGYVRRMYDRQRQRSHKRGLPMPKYTREEFIDWILSKPKFHQLFYNWVLSGYQRKFAPSIDRKDNNKTYSFDNIQLMSWKKHLETGDRQKPTRLKVEEINEFGEQIAIFKNMTHASKVTKISYWSIQISCRNNGETVFGRKFRFYTEKTLF